MHNAVTKIAHVEYFHNQAKNYQIIKRIITQFK
jgi:hypothetical protein